MRKLTSVGGATSAAMAEFHIHLSPPPIARVTPSPLSPASKCDARKCPWWPYSSSREFKTNTAMILIVLFCGLVCALAFNAAVRYIIRIHCNRNPRPQQSANQDIETANSKPSSSSAAAEAEIPAITYSKGMKLAGEEAECIICLSEFEEGERIRVLERCNHGFHVMCIQQWLASRSSCPTCRTSCVISSSPSEKPEAVH